MTQSLANRATQLREYEENERLMERMVKQEGDMLKKFENSAQIMLQE